MTAYYSEGSSWGDFMKQGIYIASKTRHAERWKQLRANGYPIISTWIDEAGPGESKDLCDLWVRCLQEAASCKILIFYQEPGDLCKGAWAEAGAALSNGIPVYAVGMMGICSLAHHHGVTNFGTVEEAFRLAGALCGIRSVFPPHKEQEQSMTEIQRRLHGDQASTVRPSTTSHGGEPPAAL